VPPAPMPADPESKEALPMKKFLFVPLAALAFGWACSESARSPVAPATDGSRMAPAPQGPNKDDISNNLDATLDATAEVMPLTVGGANGSTILAVTPRNGDGKNGCNLTGSTTLVVAIASSDQTVATVSPSSATFTACGDTRTLTITPVAAGSTTISVSQTSNNSGGTFNLAPATFTVNVSPPPNTAPTLTVGGVSMGGSYDKGSVPAATCDVVDAEDGNSSFAATLSPITGPNAGDGIGSQTASCSYTDGGGLMASASATYSIVDPSAPSISYVLAPSSPDGNGGWYKSDVTLTWTVTESESPNSLVETGCVDQNITADQTEQTYSCSATSAGGSATQVEVKIKRDGTAPSVAYTSASSAPNANGWYNDDVTATFTATDNFSGFGDPVSTTTTGTATTSGEGASVTVGSPAFTDNAGNTAAADAATSDAYKIDKTKPTNVAFVGGPSNGGTYYFGFVPAAPTCTADDALSGIDFCQVSGYSATVGPHTLTANAEDKAGNAETATSSYTVNAWTLRGFYQPVDMNNVLNTVKGGSTVPLKFNVFAGPIEITDPSKVSFSAKQITCSSSAPIDDIEMLTTGGTSLRYDVTGQQFIQNWQTPKLPGTCYQVTLTALDGSKLQALFKLK
jgi:hypothetical protein